MTLKVDPNLIQPAYERLLTGPALEFIEDLCEQFAGRISDLLAARVIRRKQIEKGELPTFLRETESIRNSEWKVDAIPEPLLDRRVDLCAAGMHDPSIIINAMNSGANGVQADFDDAHCPTWSNTVESLLNITLAIQDGEITTDKGVLHVNPNPALILLRPRSLNLYEKHVMWDGHAIPGALFDFGLFMFHNGKLLHSQHRGPYFYIPKLQNHREAALWTDIFAWSEQRVGVSAAACKCIVLIEDILAVFEMHEILHAMHERCIALNAGRWDYTFSVIRQFSTHPGFVLPDRALLTMDKAFLNSYANLLIATCRQRGALATGGMATLVPSGTAEEVNNILASITQEKLGDARRGFDGAIAFSPAAVSAVRDAFPSPHSQGSRADGCDKDSDVLATSSQQLLEMHTGHVTRGGLRKDAEVALHYIAGWLRGEGTQILAGRAEDAATAEISRSQLWQVLHHGAVLDSGEKVTEQVINQVLDGVVQEARQSCGSAEKFEAGRFPQALEILRRLVFAPVFVEFMTNTIYEYI